MKCQGVLPLRQAVYGQFQIAGPAVFCCGIHHAAVSIFSGYGSRIGTRCLDVAYFPQVKPRIACRGAIWIKLRFAIKPWFQKRLHIMIFYRLHILGVIQAQGGADFACDGRLTRRRSAVSLRRPGWGGHGKQHGSRQQSRQHPYAYFHNRHPFFVLRLQNSISM